MLITGFALKAGDGPRKSWKSAAKQLVEAGPDVHFFCPCLSFSAVFFHSPIGKKARIRKEGRGACVMSVEVASQNIKASERKGGRQGPTAAESKEGAKALPSCPFVV